MRNTLKYQLLAVASVIIVAVLGSVFVNIGMDWFNLLNKPIQWMPNIVIPIVWTIVYILAIIILCVLIKNNQLNAKLLIYFVINGILNVLWCLIFFALQLTLLGNIVIILNLIAAWLWWINLLRVNNLQGYIMLIYPIWLSIATTLNLCLWILN